MTVPVLVAWVLSPGYFAVIVRDPLELGEVKVIVQLNSSTLEVVVQLSPEKEPPALELNFTWPVGGDSELRTIPLQEVVTEVATGFGVQKTRVFVAVNPSTQ